MDLDAYGMRIFRQVMLDKTFSRAARTLQITQPTVSQQIGKLEAILGGRLFERVGHDLVPTRLAFEFQKLATEVLDRVSTFESSLQNERDLPEGLVRYAMPESCQWTPHYKHIMGQISKFPLVRFEISILPNDMILKGLLDSSFDFGFIVGERLSPELRFQKFSDEAYSVVAATRALLAPLEPTGTIEELRFITYPGWELFFSSWAKAHSQWKRMKAGLKSATVHVGTLAGAIHAAQNGAGVAVIPTHCVQMDLDLKNLVEWKSSKSITAIFETVFRVLRSTTLTLPSLPLLEKPLPNSEATAKPWTPGVSLTSPTTRSFSISTTRTRLD